MRRTGLSQGARAADLREHLRTTLSALVIVEHAAHCHRDPDDTRCIDEIGLQREHALRLVQDLLTSVGQGT